MAPLCRSDYISAPKILAKIWGAYHPLAYRRYTTNVENFHLAVPLHMKVVRLVKPSNYGAHAMEDTTSHGFRDTLWCCLRSHPRVPRHHHRISPNRRRLPFPSLQLLLRSLVP